MTRFNFLFFSNNKNLTHAVSAVTTITLWALSTDEGAQCVITAHSRETWLRKTLIYIFSTSTTSKQNSRK